MSVDVRVIRQPQHRTSAWSGGETTEIAIFPPHSRYAARDFGWRVSSATVTSDTSEFTRLPGYNRRLLLLAGELRLQPAGDRETVLHPGEQYAFRGDTPITSHGLATDFNLMLGPGWEGDLAYVILAPGDRCDWRPADGTQHTLACCWQGKVLITPAKMPAYSLDSGDLLWVASHAERLGAFDMVNEGENQATFVLVTVARESLARSSSTNELQKPC